MSSYIKFYKRAGSDLKLILLVFGPKLGLIISKLGSVKPIIVGTMITAIGYFGLTLRLMKRSNLLMKNIEKRPME